MDNPTKCAAINAKLLTDTYPGPSVETGIAVNTLCVNPTPPTTFHIQNCYRDSTVSVGSFFILDVQTNPQWTTPVPMNTPVRWGIDANAGVPAGISVELTLVNSSNNEEKVTLLTGGSGVVVYTPLSIYKNCNDVRIASNHQLLSTDYIRVRPEMATSLNNIACTLSANYKYNGLFMCCNAADGTPRKAKLIGLPQIYSGVASNFRLYKWPNVSGTSAGYVAYSVIYVDSATATAPNLRRRVETPIDGQVELLPGEACAWYRPTSSNTLAVITAHWQYNPTV